jgi:hypothetical protein
LFSFFLNKKEKGKGKEKKKKMSACNHGGSMDKSLYSTKLLLILTFFGILG